MACLIDLMLCKLWNLIVVLIGLMDWDSIVRIATHYGLDGQEIKSW